MPEIATILVPAEAARAAAAPVAALFGADVTACAADGAALFADLIVVPDAADERSFIRMLMESEKPVLLAHGLARRPERILVAWDGGLAAARALTAARPFLERAGHVEILTIGEPGGIDAEKAVEYLALGGIAAQRRTIARGGASDGAILLAAARDADLVVMGGYGHHRLIERLLGGTTAHMLAAARVPVLLAH